MKKKINYAEIMKETGILTVAVAIIAAAVYFFLVPSHASVSSISGLGIYTTAVTKCLYHFHKTVYTSVMLITFR